MTVVTYVVGEGVEIDYSLVADPNFSHDGVVLLDSKVNDVKHS